MGKGVVFIRHTLSNGESVVTRLNDVYYLPHAPNQLFSPGAHDSDLLSKKGIMHVINDDGEEIAIA